MLKKHRQAASLFGNYEEEQSVFNFKQSSNQQNNPNPPEPRKRSLHKRFNSLRNYQFSGIEGSLSHRRKVSTAFEVNNFSTPQVYQQREPSPLKDPNSPKTLQNSEETHSLEELQAEMNCLLKTQAKKQDEEQEKRLALKRQLLEIVTNEEESHSSTKLSEILKNSSSISKSLNSFWITEEIQEESLVELESSDDTEESNQQKVKIMLKEFLLSEPTAEAERTRMISAIDKCKWTKWFTVADKEGLALYGKYEEIWRKLVGDSSFPNVLYSNDVQSFFFYDLHSNQFSESSSVFNADAIILK